MTQSLPRTDEWYSLDLQTPDDTGVFDCELRLPMQTDPHRMVFVAARWLPATDRFPAKWRVFNPPESSTNGHAEYWWDVLGVTQDARRPEIETAYRRLRSTHHPDRGGDRDQFDRVQRAYESASRGWRS